MQYEKVPRKTPSVHCVTRSLEKPTMMRGENCIDARVSVISRMANTMDTTVMTEAAMPARMTWATCGSAWEGNKTVGTHALAAGNSSSKQDRTAPAQPSASAIVRGRIKKPPRRLYTAWRNINGRILLTISSSVVDQTRAHKEEQRVPPSCSIQRTGVATGIETLPHSRPPGACGRRSSSRDGKPGAEIPRCPSPRSRQCRIRNVTVDCLDDGLLHIRLARDRGGQMCVAWISGVDTGDRPDHRRQIPVLSISLPRGLVRRTVGD